MDPALAELLERTGRLGIEAADIASELSSYLAGLSADPARLAHVQSRRAALTRACQQIAGPHEQIEDVDALLAWGERAAARLAELDGPQDNAALLAERLAGADDNLAIVRAELSRDQHYAEWWLGAHHSAPSIIESDGKTQTLTEFLHDNPTALGAQSRATFGDELPYLLKILDVEKPLSI